MPPAHLKLVGQVIVLLPVPSCVMNQLIVWPSDGLLKVGAVVTLAVKVVVNTLDKLVFTVIAVAEKVTATTGVLAEPLLTIRFAVRIVPSNVRFADPAADPLEL